MKRFDVAVIGATRAGLLAADALAAAGKSVALVRTAGDDAADRLVAALNEAPETTPPAVRFEAVDGPARFLSATRLQTLSGEIEARRVIIAVGAVPTGEWALGEGPFPPLQDALSGPAPASAAVLGAGPAALIAADRLAKRGASVTLIARAARLLPHEDESLSSALAGRFRARGLQVHTGATALGWAPSGITRWNVAGQAAEAKTDVLYANTDLRPAVDDLDLKKAGVYADVNGRVVVNEEMRTSAPGIWAVGHAVTPGGPVAEHIAQAETAANNAQAGLFGRKKMEPSSPPLVIRLSPPLARVGLTESEARARHGDVIVAVAPWFERDGAAEASGLIKIIGRRRGGRLLGAHLAGAAAPETILFFDLLLRAEIPIEDVPDRRHFPVPGATDAVYRALVAWTEAAYGR